MAVNHIAQAEFTGSEPAKLFQLDQVMANVLTTLGGIAGLIVFVMLLFSGFQFITSGGDPGKVEKAKETFTWAIYGLIFIALSLFILETIEYLTGVKVSNFSIYQ